MKKHFNLTILLALLCMILVGVNAYIYIERDKKAPVISFPEEQLVYTEGTKTSELLEGVTAADDKDGDVTDSLRVYNVMIMEDGETAAIIYYAKDSSNNIASATRIAVYDGPGTTEKSDTEVDGTDNDSESVFNVVTQPDEKESASSASGDSGDSERQSASGSRDTSEDQSSSEQESGKPAIILSRNAVTVGYRSSFSSLAYIQDIKDDKDSYEDLFRRIVLNSDVSTKKRGSYTAQMYVVDSDGNKSDTVTLHVTVE